MTATLRNGILLAVVMGSIGVYTWYADFQVQGPDVQTATPAADNKIAAPDFKFAAVSGKTYSLSDLKGKPVILNFWASWCAPCVVEFPQMITLARKDKDTIFLFLSIDDSKAEAQRFLDKSARSLPGNVLIGFDADKHVSQDLYQTFKVPETYLIDRGGMIRGKIVGAADWTSAPVRQQLQSFKTP